MQASILVLFLTHIQNSCAVCVIKYRSHLDLPILIAEDKQYNDVIWSALAELVISHIYIRHAPQDFPRPYNFPLCMGNDWL